MAKHERASIQPERLGKAIRGHDVLIPTSSPPSSKVTPLRPETPAPVVEHAVAESPKAEAQALPREPVTVRLSKQTVKRMARARMELLDELDLRVSQSDLVEAAILHALKKPGELAFLIQELQSGAIFNISAKPESA